MTRSQKNILIPNSDNKENILTPKYKLTSSKKILRNICEIIFFRKIHTYKSVKIREIRIKKFFVFWDAALQFCEK